MQGIFIKGQRPKSKKAIKTADAADISIEGTSMFGGDYDGPALEAPEGKSISFVGPDPYTKRSFYGTLLRKGNTLIIK
jgi:hypothetical protein